MTTARRTNQITDEFNRPVPGAQVYVYNVDDSLATLTSDGTIPLANPVITDAFGNYSYYAAVGYYREDVWFNGSKRWGENNVAVGVVTTTPSGTAANARTVMAAIGAPLAGQSAILTESGREGTFVFSTANLSAQVTADTQQGLYVAPASDVTGASGAWVRKFSACADARWFDFVADMTADGVGTDNTPMFNAARAALIAAGRNWLHIPQQSAAYRFSTAPSAIHDGILVTGEGWYPNAGQVGVKTYIGIQQYPGTVLGFAPDVPGFKLVAYTDQPSNAKTFQYQGAEGSTFQDLMLYSEGGTGTTSHGIESFVKFNLRNVRIQNFAGCGVKIEGDDSGTANQYGNAILSNLTDVWCVGNKLHGYHIIGSNGSVIGFTRCFAQLNGGVGFLDQGPFGNAYAASVATTNNASFGTPAGFSAAQRAQVVADYAGLATQTVGSFVCLGSSCASAYFACYSESGNGTAPDLSFACVVNGGALSAVALQFNVGTNGNPTINSNAGLSTFKVILDRAQANLGAISAKAAVYRHADQGLVLHGAPDGGGTTDVTIKNKSDTAVIQIPTGTTTTRHFGPVWTDAAAFFINGASAFPGLIATQAAMFTTATNGLVLAGFGSANDTVLANKSGTVALGVPTGTNVVAVATNTVAALPAAPPVGSRSFVTDATATTFASAVAGGGANKVPVYFDGVSWKIG